MYFFVTIERERLEIHREYCYSSITLRQKSLEASVLLQCVCQIRCKKDESIKLK